jgi:hypothetical protein
MRGKGNKRAKREGEYRVKKEEEYRAKRNFRGKRNKSQREEGTGWIREKTLERELTRSICKA